MHEYQKELKRGTLNLSYETTYLIMVFKINVSFVLLKEELPNGTSENLESFRFEISLSMFQILLLTINLSSEQRAQ